MEELRGVGWWTGCYLYDQDRSLEVRFKSNSDVAISPMAKIQVSFKRRFYISDNFNDNSLLEPYADVLQMSEFSHCVIVNTEQLMFAGTREGFVDNMVSSFPMVLDDINHVKGYVCSFISDELQDAYGRGHSLATFQIQIEYEWFLRDGDDLKLMLERHRLETIRAMGTWDQFHCPTSRSIVFCGNWEPPEEHRTPLVSVWNGGDEEECAICMEKYVVGSTRVVELPCRHVFHQSCIYKWVLVNSSCPLCRLKL